MPAITNSADREGSQSAEGLGKFVVIGIIGLILVIAGGAWLYRYNLTHRAVRFWGPEATSLIRDASTVTLFEHPIATPRTLESQGILNSGASAAETAAAVQKHFSESAIDVSNARGLVHLRNALLEDANYIWPAGSDVTSNPAEVINYWWLSFHDPNTGKTVTLWFTKD
jgi:hypothetical protein